MIKAYEYDKYTTVRIIKGVDKNRIVVSPVYLPRTSDRTTELSLLPSRARNLKVKGYANCSLVVMGVNNLFDARKFKADRAIAYADIGKAGDVTLYMRTPKDGSQNELAPRAWYPTIKAMERLIGMRNSMIDSIRGTTG